MYEYNHDTYCRRCDVCGCELPRHHEGNVCTSHFLWAHEIEVEYKIKELKTAMARLGNIANVLHVGLAHSKEVA